MSLELTIPTTWHAGPHALPSHLVSYFPRSIWMLISSYFDADHLIHALSHDEILALWVKQIDLRVIGNAVCVGMKSGKLLHNPFGGPAEIQIYWGGCREEIWYKNGERHRLDGPAYIETCPDGIRIETWYENDKCHRINQPAHIVIRPDGHRTEIWYENGKPHRVGGPAFINIYPNGHRREEWYQNGERHRLDGPAFIEIYPDGRRTEIWYKDDIVMH